MKKTAHMILNALTFVTVFGFLGCTEPTPKELLQEAIYNNQDVTHWDISSITDMSRICAYYYHECDPNFCDSYPWHFASDFNQDISDWDVSHVTNMNAMFESAEAFNQNIGNWNTSNVTDMSVMFSGATSFNQDISNWNTAKVTDMNRMFNGASSFNQDLSAWNVSNVTSASDTFNASGLSQENYCKMITTNEGWKRLSEEFDLGLDYTCE